METCSICLNTVRETRQNKPLRCGHLFHSHCIENWKRRGHQTCPVGRKIFDGANWKVTLTVRNMIHDTSYTQELSEELVFDTLDIVFDTETVTDLESLLSDFGMSVSNLDPLVLNTE